MTTPKSKQIVTPQGRKSRLLQYNRNFNFRRFSVLTLNIGQEIRKGKTNEPIAIKAIIGWVLMRGKLEIYQNCVTSNKLNLQNLDTLSESAELFWELETFGTPPKTDLTLLPKNEQKAVKDLRTQ